jgi:[protein-PII] uridylyltransferase
MNNTARNLESFLPGDLICADVPFDERRDKICDGARQLLEKSRQELFAQHRAGASGAEIVQHFTTMIDAMISALFKAAATDKDGALLADCALIAIGGYGRGELNPRSDIDIMFYCGNSKVGPLKKTTERLLYMLWDLGLDVGYSVRSTKDCLDMAQHDITARTALLDSRFLIGNRELYKEYINTVYKDALNRGTQAFIRSKLEENEVRQKKYGSTVYLLEPNIKEGEGGLRDLHSALWIMRVKYKADNLRDLVKKGVVSEQEEAAFTAALNHLWRVRNELHFISPRKNEQLNFDQQEKIAHFLGYVDTRKAPAVELFMQDYYFQATQIEHLASTLISRVTAQAPRPAKFLGSFGKRQVSTHFYVLKNELRLSKPEVFDHEPEMMMQAFLLAHQHQVELSIELKSLIREKLPLINDRVRRSRVMAEGFLEILRTMRPDSMILRDMHHLQFLNAFMPEFKRIYCKVQHDVYHIYTVDMHSIFAVEEIAKLWAGEYAERKPLLTKLAGDIEKKELLQLAILLHDIGKGEGKDHANKGADMVPTIARRLRLKREDSQRLEFLVRNHLDMAHISQRRDLNDDKLIDQFATKMGMTETLKMLYLLTFADIKAVGPDVWSEWKGFLLKELYEKAYDVLERGNFRYDHRSDRLKNRKRKVVENLGEEFGERKVKSTLKTMSNRYLLSHRSHEITEHLRLAFSRGKDKTLVLKVEHDKASDYSQVYLSTVDVPGLFSMITGVMAANGVNILGAQVYTRSNGEALDILQVRSSAGSIIDNPKKWQKVEKDLNAVIEGRKQVSHLVEKRLSGGLLPEKPKPRFSNRVEINNEISDQYSVIDIYARDRVGLLYDITRTLSDVGLYIGVSKISTKVDQVADTFYVQDIFGQKVQGEEKIAEVKKALLETLSDASDEKESV